MTTDWEATESALLQSLIKARKDAGFSQKQVEAAFSWRPNQLYDLEKGRQKLTVLTALKLLAYYQQSPLTWLGSVVGQPESLPKPETSVAPLQAVGLLTGSEHPVLSAMLEDPVIVAEVGITNVGKRPLMALLLEQLTHHQQRAFLLDVYRYLNSMIASDGIIRDTELAWRDRLLAQSPIDFTDKEQASIARALRSAYLGKSVSRAFPRPAFKHCLVWLLHLVARSEGKPQHQALTYLERVAENLELDLPSYRYIDQRVAEVCGDDDIDRLSH